MKRYALSIALLPLLLTSCVSGKGWQGFVPGKDIDMDDATITVSTPWGTQTIHAKQVRSRVNPQGKRAVSLDPVPVSPTPSTNTTGYILLQPVGTLE